MRSTPSSLTSPENVPLTEVVLNWVMPMVNLGNTRNAITPVEMES
ncbi:hypothetical protein [Flavihumibacter sp. ZG627]|nr:hypothetical protein [Flavihumibacter sp. ZG627]